MIEKLQDWVQDRLRERTSLDGAVLIGVGIGVLILKPFLPLLAFIAIGYGVYTLFKSDSNS
jgi:hypothetical protein